MKLVWIMIAILGIVDLIFVWACCQAAGNYDDQELSYLDAEWSLAEESGEE